MQELFKAAVERGASDIHIKAGDVIRARINGDLQPLTQQRLSVEQVTGIAMKLIPHEEDRENFDKLMDYDCSWGIPGIGRFRVNIMKKRGSPMIVISSPATDICPVESCACAVIRLGPAPSTVVCNNTPLPNGFPCASNHWIAFEGNSPSSRS